MALIEWQQIDLSEDIDEVRCVADPGTIVDALGQILAAGQRPSWHQHAACRGLADVFFLERGDDVRPAQRICAGCPVQVECLRAGMAERHGIWAGTSERVRKRLRRAA